MYQSLNYSREWAARSRSSRLYRSCSETWSWQREGWLGVEGRWNTLWMTKHVHEWLVCEHLSKRWYLTRQKQIYFKIWFRYSLHLSPCMRWRPGRPLRTHPTSDRPEVPWGGTWCARPRTRDQSPVPRYRCHSPGTCRTCVRKQNGVDSRS